MRKVLTAIFVLFGMMGTSYATHRFVINATNITAGTLPDARLSATGASAGTYGTPPNIPQLTVDINGRITSITNIGASLSTGSLCLNLVISTNGTNTTQIVTSADYMDIMGYMAVNYSTTVDLSVVGPGGVDSAAGKQSSSWYTYFAISNDSGTFLGGIASTATGNSSSLPIMPAGYTKWRQLGRVRVNSSGNLIPTRKLGNQVTYWTSQNVLNASSNQSAYTDVGLESIVSSAAVSVNLQALVGDVSSTFGKGARIQLRPKGCSDGGGPTPWYFGTWRGDATTGEQGSGFIALPLCGQRRFQYQQTGTDDNTIDQLFIEVFGYQENIP